MRNRGYSKEQKQLLSPTAAKSSIIAAYKNLIVKAYCTVRFRIMNMQILEEIGKHLPSEGLILDLGCGFGLFTLYYAMLSPERRFLSIDNNLKRIEFASSASQKLDLDGQTCFKVMDVTQLEDSSHSCNACYMLDIVHHLSSEQQKPLIKTVSNALVPGGILVVKDIATSSFWRLLFTWILDVAMNPRSLPNYVSTTDMRKLLEDEGFSVTERPLYDILPYPHVLYVCKKIRGLS